MLIGRKQLFIQIPEGINVKLDKGSLTVKGKLGELTKDFSHTKVEMEVIDDQIHLNVNFPRRKNRAVIGTVQAHINNMFDGVRFGYQYSLKIVYSHFPIRVSPEMKNQRVKIENLYGGRKPRFASIYKGVNVKVDNEDVILDGIDKEAVGQSAANIQELCRQRGKRRQSPKTFMDGIYVYEKGLKNPAD